MASAHMPAGSTEPMMNPHAHHPTSFTVAPEDLRTIYYYYAVLAVLVAFFALWSWSRYLALLSGLKSTSTAARVVSAPSRLIRRFSVPKLIGFTSRGHAIAVTLYIALNIAIIFTDVDWSELMSFARRLGWVASENIAFLFFLGMKNTPLGYLTGYSYERINGLHQIAGYTTVLLVILHASVFIAARAEVHALYNLYDSYQIWGIVAGFTMITIGLTSLFLRKRQYEVFYVIHVLASLVILLTVWQHRPYIRTDTAIIILTALCLFVLDRTIRYSRYLIHLGGTTATLAPLPNNGTRITLSRGSKRARPGTHAWLFLPSIQRAQAHPFTIVTNNPLSFVIAAQDGFTRDIHHFAQANPSVSVKATFDGPYGTLPKFERYERVVLVAGGSGASWTIAVAMDLLERTKGNMKCVVEFIWVVRTSETLSWFTTELRTLKSHPNVNLFLHVTDILANKTSKSSSTTDIELLPLPQNMHLSAAADSITPTPNSEIPDPINASSINPSHADPIALAKATPMDLPVAPQTGERPNLGAAIKEAINAAGREERVVVGVCGPQGMVTEARRAVGESIKTSGPSVELHVEGYGW
ncbi:MAG: hypothetical protein M1836_004081 [Candelina mexicana]|nr:MAG: hypothetical protein M1836_004081 [Candelina mexicana]